MRTALERLGSAPFAGFSLDTVGSQALAAGCAFWPPAPRPPVLPGAVPDVPVLVLSGSDDLRTPLEDAQRIAARYPRATLFVGTGTGHSVLRYEDGRCGRSAVDAFLTRRVAAPCESPRWPAAPYRPARMATLPAVRETIAALRRDRAGAFSGWFTRQVAAHLPGLRAGYAFVTRRWMTLHGVEWFRGVRITGRITDADDGRFVVAGHGSLRVRNGQMTGRLDGRRVVSRL
jgi:hypothetical protein